MEPITMEMERRTIESAIQSKLAESILACDLLLTLFSASLTSYRRATICNPFPEQFKQGKERNFEEAQKCLNELPSLVSLSQPEALSQLPFKSLLFLHSVLNPPHLSLKQVPLEQYESNNHYYSANPACRPSYIFEVVYKDTYKRARTFANHVQQQSSKTYAFHGTAIENVHCALHEGLTVKFSKDASLFGAGIYLALDNRVAENFFALGSSGWKRSLFSTDKVGCIFGCEVVDSHPSVKYVGANQQVMSPNAAPGVANKKSYIVVENEECVQVKHLLLFETRAQSATTSNKCMYMLVLYVLLLAFVASLK